MTDLTIEMLQMAIKTNRFPFTHGEIAKHLLAIMLREAKLREALEHYQAVDDGAVHLLKGFRATRVDVDERSLARQALNFKRDV